MNHQVIQRMVIFRSDMPNSSPFRTVKLASATACTFPKRFVSPSTVMAGSPLMDYFLSSRMDALRHHRGTFQSAPVYSPEACLSTASAYGSISRSRTLLTSICFSYYANTFKILKKISLFDAQYLVRHFFPSSQCV